jgi:hypothetical protein
MPPNRSHDAFRYAPSEKGTTIATFELNSLRMDGGSEGIVETGPDLTMMLLGFIARCGVDWPVQAHGCY